MGFTEKEKQELRRIAEQDKEELEELQAFAIVLERRVLVLRKREEET